MDQHRLGQVLGLTLGCDACREDIACEPRRVRPSRPGGYQHNSLSAYYNRERTNIVILNMSNFSFLLHINGHKNSIKIDISCEISNLASRGLETLPVFLGVR